MTHPVLPEAQAFSDALMMTRYMALLVKECALECQNKMFALQNRLMAEPGSKMLAMETGEMEAALLRLAAVHGDVKAIHKMANDLGRKHNVAMPANPTYDPRYLDLAQQVVPVALSSLARR